MLIINMFNANPNFNMKTKTIGIIGGMGPEGTADLYMKIVRYCQKNFGAKYDNDFPPIIIYSVPIPDVVESLENEKITLSMLSEAAKTLEDDGCDFLVIACNTVQFLLEDIRKSVKIPIIGIAEVNANYAKKEGYKKVGILGTEVTVNKVYDQELQEIGIKLVKPTNEDQKKLTQVIMAQLAGKATKKEKEKLKEVIKNLNTRGAEAILIACTDLPPVIKQEDVDIHLIDCTQIYADETAKISFKN